MGTTLTRDADVAAALDQLRRMRNIGLTARVSELLRAGLTQALARPTGRERFRTQSMALGRLRIPSLDNVSEALAVGEGESFR